MQNGVVVGRGWQTGVDSVGQYMDFAQAALLAKQQIQGNADLTQAFIGQAGSLNTSYKSANPTNAGQPYGAGIRYLFDLVSQIDLDGKRGNVRTIHDLLLNQTQAFELLPLYEAYKSAEIEHHYVTDAGGTLTRNLDREALQRIAAEFHDREIDALLGLHGSVRPQTGVLAKAVAHVRATYKGPLSLDNLAQVLKLTGADQDVINLVLQLKHRMSRHWQPTGPTGTHDISPEAAQMLNMLIFGSEEAAAHRIVIERSSNGHTTTVTDLDVRTQITTTTTYNDFGIATVTVQLPDGVTRVTQYDREGDPVITRPLDGSELPLAKFDPVKKIRSGSFDYGPTNAQWGMRSQKITLRC